MSTAELKAALRESLARRGVWNQMRAQMRAEVFSALDDPQDVRPGVPEANIVLNELIREYLAFNGYNHSLSVFLQEASCSAEALPRSLLAHQTHLPKQVGTTPSSGADLPLLYALRPPKPAAPSAAAAPAAAQPRTPLPVPAPPPPALLENAPVHLSVPEKARQAPGPAPVLLAGL